MEPIPWDLVSKLVAGMGGGGVTVFITLLVADRLGFIKRKNGNGNTNGHLELGPIIDAIREGDERVVHQLQAMSDRQEKHTQMILDALYNRQKPSQSGF